MGKGEPWSLVRSGENVVDIHEAEKPGCPSLIAENVDADYADHIRRCVNALSGCNPEAVRELVELQLAISKGLSAMTIDEFCDLQRRRDDALAKVGEPS